MPPKRRTDPSSAATILHECVTALRESAAEHTYRADAMRAVRDRTLSDFHRRTYERLWSLADDIDQLAHEATLDAMNAAALRRHSTARAV